MHCEELALFNHYLQNLVSEAKKLRFQIASLYSALDTEQSSAAHGVCSKITISKELESDCKVEDGKL